MRLFRLLPNAVNRRRAMPAFPSRDIILDHSKSRRFDEALSTAGTEGILPSLSGDIAAINISEAGPPSNLPCPVKCRSRGFWKAEHLIGRIECGDMPGNLCP